MCIRCIEAYMYRHIYTYTLFLRENYLFLIIIMCIHRALALALRPTLRHSRNPHVDSLLSLLSSSPNNSRSRYVCMHVCIYVSHTTLWSTFQIMYVYVCMYVCVCWFTTQPPQQQKQVCMYVSMYVCVYLMRCCESHFESCMCMYACMYVCVDSLLSLLSSRSKYVRMYVCMYLTRCYETHLKSVMCMYVCVFVDSLPYMHTYQRWFLLQRRAHMHAYIHTYLHTCTTGWFWLERKAHSREKLFPIHTYIHTYMYCYSPYIHTYTSHMYYRVILAQEEGSFAREAISHPRAACVLLWDSRYVYACACMYVCMYVSIYMAHSRGKLFPIQGLHVYYFETAGMCMHVCVCMYVSVYMAHSRGKSLYMHICMLMSHAGAACALLWESQYVYVRMYVCMCILWYIYIYMHIWLIYVGN